jgi:hypothetical protein
MNANWPSGSWQASCNGANVAGSAFTASCRANNGSMRRSSIDLNRCPGRLVGNNNGTLFCEGGGQVKPTVLPGGSWQNSCNGARMSGNVFYASCSTGNGYRSASFNLAQCPGWALGNRNGSLFCETSGGNWGPGHFPGGSWQNSCGNAKLNGSTFSAQCSTGNGYRQTTIDLRGCPSRLVGNRNGFLFCER